MSESWFNHSWFRNNYMEQHGISCLTWPFGKTKLNQWQPAEADQMRPRHLPLRSLRHFDSFAAAAIRLCLNLDPTLTISSWITGLKLRAFNCDSVNETHSFTEPRWLHGRIGFSHYRGGLLFLTDDVSRYEHDEMKSKYLADKMTSNGFR